MLAELELLSGTPARLVEGETITELASGARFPITSHRLHIHQGLGRACPRASLSSGHRLELDDGTVTWGTSGGHCQVWLQVDGIVVEDRGSDNGTIAGPPESPRHLTGLGARGFLIEGDLLQVGRVQFVVHTKPPSSR